MDDYDANLHATSSAPPAQPDARGRNDGNAASANEELPGTDAAPAAVATKAGKRFNPLGNKPRKRSSQYPATVEPSPEQFQASLDGLAAAMEQMIQGVIHQKLRLRSLTCPVVPSFAGLRDGTYASSHIM